LGFRFLEIIVNSDQVIKYGRDVRGLAKRYEEHDRAIAIAPRVVSKDRSNKRDVDREDVREVDRRYNGNIRTDR
jgi:hypothetical protein